MKGYLLAELALSHHVPSCAEQDRNIYCHADNMRAASCVGGDKEIGFVKST